MKELSKEVPSLDSCKELKDIGWKQKGLTPSGWW